MYYQRAVLGINVLSWVNRRLNGNPPSITNCWTSSGTHTRYRSAARPSRHPLVPCWTETGGVVGDRPPETRIASTPLRTEGE